MALLLNFIPYLGALVGIAVVTAVSIITFDSLGTAIVAPVIYASCNLIESQLVTPAVLDRRLSLNPVIVFISVIFWGWLWGLPGAMMAVPLLIIVHVVCSHIPAVHFLAEMLTMKSNDCKVQAVGRQYRLPGTFGLKHRASIPAGALRRPSGHDAKGQRSHDNR